MPKELEYLEELKDYIEYFTRLDYVDPIVRGEVHQKFKDIYWNKLPHLDVIEQALLNTEKYKEAWEIVKEKNVNILILKLADTVDEYNERIKINSYKLTQKEFNLLKEDKRE